jgi:hypothetical protein
LPQLGSSNEIKKDAARGSAALALLPSRESLGSAYSDLQARIDDIVTQAQLVCGLGSQPHLWL